jgi:exopolyphosphatase/guanosine-5'-triphosphate,3'-diphosphate pyrophosphatase
VAEDEDRRLREVLAQRVFTQLGAAHDEGGAILPEKVAQVAQVVAHQVRVASELDADRVRVVATSAVRGAANADALAEAIEVASGCPIEVLTGEEEARLAFAGAIGMLADPPAGELGVVDVGGGSTELVVGTAAAGVTWSVSLPVGSSVITDTDLRGDPPSVEELERLRSKIGAIFGHLDAPQPSAAYAVGGSATSLQQLVGAQLDAGSLARGLRALVGEPADQVAQRLGLHAARVRLLPAGILLLDAAARALRAPLRMGSGGLREGVVLEELRRMRAG